MTQSYSIDEIDRTSTSPSSDIDKLTNAHDANRSNFSGIGDPSTSVAYQIYADTANNVYKQRDSENSVWNIISSASETPVLTISADRTSVLSDYDGLLLVDASTGPVTITLPLSATTGNGWNVKVKKTDNSSNAVIVSSADLIDGSATLSIIKQNITVGVRTNGTTYSVNLNDPSANSAPGNLVLLQTFTPSAVSDNNIISLITNIYDDYIIRYSLSFSTSGSILQVLGSIDNGTNFITTGYSFAHATVNSAGSQGNLAATSTSSWSLINSVSATAGDIAQGEVKFKGLLNTSNNKIFHAEADHINSSSAFVNYVGGGQLASVSAINALKVSVNTGTMTGIIDFFGIQL